MHGEHADSLAIDLDLMLSATSSTPKGTKFSFFFFFGGGGGKVGGGDCSPELRQNMVPI